MIFIDCSDTHVSILDADRDMLGKLHIKHAQGIELKEHDSWASVVAPHAAGKQAAFTVPGTSSYIRYFEIPSDITDTAIHKSVIDKAHMAIPASVDELAYDMQVIGTSQDGSRTVMFAAASHSVIDSYNQLKMSRAMPFYAIPRPIALFETIRPAVTEGSHVLFVEAGTASTTFTIFNSYGPVSVATEKSTVDKPHGMAIKTLNTIVTRYGASIKGVMISGRQYEKDLTRYFKEAGIPVLDLKQMLHDKITASDLQMPATTIPVVALAHLLGLMMLASRKDAKNLLRPEALARLPDAGPSRVSEKRRLPEFTLPAHRILIFAGLIIAAGVVTFFLLHAFRPHGETVEPEVHRPVANAPAATDTPTPTPTVAIDRASFKIQILNGSGAVGAGSKAAAYLEEKGYKKLDTGNADSYDYDQTEVQVKDGRFTPALIADLKDKYSISSKAAAIKESSPYDAVIIIGKR